MGTTSMTRGAAVSLAGQWAKYAVQILTLVLFSRLLGPDDFGLVAMATAVTGVAWVIGDFGLSMAALQAERLEQDQKTMLFWINTGIGLTMTAVLALASVPVSDFYGDRRLVAIVLATSVMFAANGIGTQFRIEINRRYRFATLAGIDVTAQVAGFLLGLGVILAGGGYWGIVVSLLAPPVVSTALFVLRAGWLPGRPRRGVRLRQLLTYGGDTLLVQLVTYVSSNVDAVLLGRSQGAQDLGFYNRSYQLAALPIMQMAAPLTRVVLPVLSSRRADPTAYQDLVTRLQLSLGYGLVGVLSIGCALADPLVEVVLGAEWAPSAPILQILTVASAFQVLSYIYYWTLLAQARTRVLFWSELLPRSAMVAMVVWAAPHGPLRVAGALVVGQVLMWIVGAFYAVPRAGLRTSVVLAACLRPLLVHAWAAGMTLLVTSAAGLSGLDGWSALAVGVLIWAALALSTLVVPAVRGDVLVLRATLRRVVAR